MTATLTQEKTHTLERKYDENGPSGVMMWNECINCGVRAEESLTLIGEACPDVSTEPAAILADMEATRENG